MYPSVYTFQGSFQFLHECIVNRRNNGTALKFTLTHCYVKCPASPVAHILNIFAHIEDEPTASPVFERTCARFVTQSCFCLGFQLPLQLVGLKLWLCG